MFIGLKHYGISSDKAAISSLSNFPKIKNPRRPLSIWWNNPEADMLQVKFWSIDDEHIEHISDHHSCSWKFNFWQNSVSVQFQTHNLEQVYFHIRISGRKFQRKTTTWCNIMFRHIGVIYDNAKDSFFMARITKIQVNISIVDWLSYLNT